MYASVHVDYSRRYLSLFFRTHGARLVVQNLERCGSINSPVSLTVGCRKRSKEDRGLAVV